MELVDDNGRGKWSREALIARYALYCRQYHVGQPLDLTPAEVVQGDRRWVFPVMGKVIAGIETGDVACQHLGVEFLEEDTRFPFGKILKSNTARALRRTPLCDELKDRLRKRLAAMLLNGNVPHEYKQYAKLLKRIGIGRFRRDIETRVDRTNPYAMRYYRYLTLE